MKKNRRNEKRRTGDVTIPMIIFGKTKSDWKALELYYRREWICFVVGFVIGAVIL